MVERNDYLDGLFHSLADPYRRDMLRRLGDGGEFTVSQLAAEYDISLAAIAKHLTVLDKASLITKQRRGKKQVVTIAPGAVRDASLYLERYRALWEHRYAALDELLTEARPATKEGS